MDGTYNHQTVWATMTRNNHWSCEQDEILINFVKHHEIIYNVKARNYRNQQLKQNVWRECGKILNRTDVSCSKRWVYIRDYYIRRRGKPGIGSTGEAAKRRADLMSFLDGVPSPKKTFIGSLTHIPDTEDTSSTDYIDQSEPIATKKETLDIEENYIETSKNELFWEEDETDYTYDSGVKDTDNSEMRKNSEEQLQLLKQIAHQQSQALPSAPGEKDETDLFFNSMAKIVKKLPQYERAHIRMQIGSLVGNAELKYLSTQT